jgi:hypothetical protein
MTKLDEKLMWKLRSIDGRIAGRKDPVPVWLVGSVISVLVLVAVGVRGV